MLYDNFDDHRESWSEIRQEWEVILDEEANGIYRTSFASTDTEALAIPIGPNMFTWNDYTIQAKMLSKNGVDQYLWARVSNDLNSYYAVDLRAWGWVDSNNIRVKKVVDNQRVWFHELDPSQIGCDIMHNQWYGVRLNVKGSTVSVDIKCSGEEEFRNIFSITDEEDPLIEGGVALSAWSGSWWEGVEKWFDEVKVFSEIESDEKYPLILIPGLGASWNTRAMVYGEDVSPEDWEMTPFVNIYDRLTETGINNGYILGKDFFVWNYDWRKAIADISLDLDNYISDVPELNSAEKIDFVGHSLGGIVGRTWLQNNPEKADKLITVGSPHYGAVQAYEAIAGGAVDSKNSLEQIIMKLFLQIHKRGFQTDAEVIRELAPVLQDLVPRFDFIKKCGTTVVPIEQISFPNRFLSQLNQEADILSFSHFLVGNTGISTPEWLITRRRSLIDQILNLWPDGHPSAVIDGIGDGTVLRKSAYFQGGYNPELEYNLSHGALINDAQTVEKIFNLLGKEDVVVAGPESNLLNNLLVFYLASPATLEVNGLTPTDSDLQFIVIPDPLPGSYQAQVTGTEAGNYHLFIGQINPSKSFWKSYQGETFPGEKDFYQFEINPDNPLPDPLIDKTGLKNIDLAQSLLQELIERNSSRYLSLSLNRLKMATLKINQQRWLSAIRETKMALYYLSRFRKGLDENQIEDYNQTGEVMGLLVNSWRNILENQNLTSKNRAYRQYQKAKSYHFSAERLTQSRQRIGRKIRVTKALSLKSSGEIIGEIKTNWKEKNYAFVEPNSFLAYLFALESLGR